MQPLTGMLAAGGPEHAVLPHDEKMAVAGAGGGGGGGGGGGDATTPGGSDPAGQVKIMP